MIKIGKLGKRLGISSKPSEILGTIFEPIPVIFENLVFHHGQENLNIHMKEIQ